MRLKSLMTPGQIVDRLYQIVFDMQKADERLLTRVDFDTITHDEMRSLAASLLTGDTQFIRTSDETAEQAALDPDWGSWIEGQPVTSAILSNRAVLIDLLPLDPAQFAARYRITVGQFIAIAKWFQKNGKRLHINIRDVDLQNPETFMAYANQTESIGLILQELEDNSLFYCLPARRELLFSLSDGNRPQDRQRLKRQFEVSNAFVTEHFERLRAPYEALPAPEDRTDAQDIIAGASVRGGQLIAPAQLAWRLAYYRAYTAMFSEFESTRIDEIFALDKPDAVEMATLARLVTLYHHRFTAPITGAFGGTYNLSLSEYGPMLDEIDLGSAKDKIHGLTTHSSLSEAERELWEWVATERVRKEGKRVQDSVSTAFAMVQRQREVRDEVVDYILNQAKPITDDIQAYRNDLLRGVRSNLLNQMRGSERPLSASDYAEAFESYSAGGLLGEMEKAVEKANSVGSVVAGTVLFGFGLSFTSVTAWPAMTGVASLFISPEALQTVLDEAATEPTKTGLGKLVARMRGRTPTNMMISGILDDIGALQDQGRKVGNLGV